MNPQSHVSQVGRSRRCASMEARPSLRRGAMQRLLRGKAPRN